MLLFCCYNNGIFFTNDIIMNENNNKKTESDFNQSQPSSLLKDMLAKYGSFGWNIILFFIGLYLVWTTLSVVLNILGCGIGLFLIFYSLFNIKLLNLGTMINFFSQLLNRR
jgi:hypothetical protein